MNKTASIFDLDGTLLNSKEEMTERTINAIKKIYEKGAFIIIASGRMYKSTKLVINKYLSFLKEIPIISYNGAYVVSHNGEVIFESDIDKNLSIEVINEAKKENLHVQIYLNDELITDNDNDEIKGYAKHSGVDYKIVNNLEEYIINTKNGPTKILTIADEKKLDIFQSKMTLMYNNKLNIVRSFNIYLDFLNKDTSKGNALKKISQMYNLDLKNAYIFGDSENDISMLILSKNSYAMGNAANHVKEFAKNIALSSDEEGVAIVIEKILSNYSNN
jgi:Cof subfamily protein (haloacid dehalogenase superfamily)